jgi:hypothetical protein
VSWNCSLTEWKANRATKAKIPSLIFGGCVFHISGRRTLYEVELREPLKSLASKKYTVGLNGLAEFEMFSEPHVAAGDGIQIDAYEPGEKILEGGGLEILSQVVYRGRTHPCWNDWLSDLFHSDRASQYSSDAVKNALHNAEVDVRFQWFMATSNRVPMNQILQRSK